MAKVERELIERAVARAKNNKARAARMLGLTRPRLYRRMVQLGLIEEEGDGRRELATKTHNPVLLCIYAPYISHTKFHGLFFVRCDAGRLISRQ